MRIILDAMGGDNAPLEIVKGALQAHRDFGVDIVLTGREEDIRQAAAQCGETLPEGVTIRHCTETIEMCDDPALACRRKKDSSMRRCIPKSTISWPMELPPISERIRF